jgi:integrase
MAGPRTIARAKGGGTSTHTVARDDLGALRKMRKATNGPWVFETERGGPLSVDAMQYIVRGAGEAAGTGDAIHPHMLRHGAGYALINDGVDVRLVQEFLGHASITATFGDTGARHKLKPFSLRRVGGTCASLVGKPYPVRIER